MISAMVGGGRPVMTIIVGVGAAVLLGVIAYFISLGRSVRQQVRPPLPSNYKEMLQHEIRNAGKLIAYASSNAIPLKQEEVKAIIEAYRAGDNLTSEQEASFWTSASSISKAVTPVTIDSLNCSSFGSTSEQSSAALAARKYRTRTLITLAALLLFQMYWLVGATVTSDLKDIRTRLEKLQTESQVGRAAEAALDDKDVNYASKKSKLDAESNAFTDKLYVEKVSAAADFEVLRHWNIARGLLLGDGTKAVPRSNPQSKGGPDQEGVDRTPSDYFLWVFTQENVEDFQTAQITLTALLKYILPILYGALGASAYIVRTLATEIKEHTYSLGSAVRYELRFFLGAVAGLSIAWFTSDPKSAESAGILQSLSPLALAFLAGYSVELLFSLLDRLVSAFSGPEPKRVP